MAAEGESGLGVGIGWRAEIAGFVGSLPGLRFTEVIAEGIAPDDPPRDLVALRDRGVAVVPHGVRLSLGGAEPVAPERVDHLARCARALDAPLVSEHIAFVRAGGTEAGHLLPVPRTRASLKVLAANIERTREVLPVPLAVETIAALFDWPDDEYTEAEFLAELVERTGVRLVLDVANVYANARNRGRDPWDLLAALPLDHIAYCHVAGGVAEGGRYHDTHTAPVPDAVLELVGRLAGRGRLPGVLLERDGRYPPAAELRAELDTLARAAGMDPVT